MRRFEMRKSRYWLSLEYFEQRIHLANDLVADRELENSREPEITAIGQYSVISGDDKSIENKPTAASFPDPDASVEILAEETMDDFNSDINFDAHQPEPYKLVEFGFDHDIQEDIHRCDDLENPTGYSVAGGDPLNVDLDGSVIDNSELVFSDDSSEENSKDDDDNKEPHQLPLPGSSANTSGTDIPANKIDPPAGQGKTNLEIGPSKEQVPGGDSKVPNPPNILAGNTPVSGNAFHTSLGNPSLVVPNLTMPLTDRPPLLVPPNKPSEMERFSSTEIGVIVLPDESVAEAAEETAASRDEVDPQSIPSALAAISYFPVQTQDNKKKQELRATYSEQSAEHIVETNPIEQLQNSIDAVLTANFFEAIYAEEGAQEAAILPIAFTIPAVGDPSVLEEQIEMATGSIRAEVLSGSTDSSLENTENEESTDYRPYLSFLMAGFLFSLPHTRKLLNQRNKEEKALQEQVNSTLEDSSNS